MSASLCKRVFSRWLLNRPEGSLIVEGFVRWANGVSSAWLTQKRDPAQECIGYR
jgi:hypothetical protein